jgi:hypothetical protein
LTLAVNLGGVVVWLLHRAFQFDAPFSEETRQHTVDDSSANLAFDIIANHRQVGLLKRKPRASTEIINVTNVAVFVEYSPFGLELFWEMATLVTILDK